MNEDIIFKILGGIPIEIDNVCKIYPLSLREIAIMGYSKYEIILSNLVFEPKDLLQGVSVNVNLDDITTFDVIVGNIARSDIDYYEFICNAVQIFVREPVSMLVDNEKAELLFLIGNPEDCRYINRDNYNLFKEYLKFMNCINEEEKFDPGNKHARDIMNKILNARAKRKERGMGLSICDLVSTLSANSNSLNILNIYDLNVFQMHDQLARMQMIEEYDFNLRALLAGAKKEALEIKHYLRKIVKEPNEN